MNSISAIPAVNPRTAAAATPAKLPWLTRYARLRRLTFFMRCIYKGGGISLRYKVLDIGSGDGWFTSACLKSTLCDCIGVDPCYGPGIRAGAEKLPFADGTFDCVVLWEVIEHIKPECYEEIERVLRPGGKIILSTPIPRWNWFVELCERLGFVRALGTPHINLLDVKTLPWDLCARSNILHIDQLACFEV